jgi:hypothetical protein
LRTAAISSTESQRQRAEGHEFALGDEDDARNDEHQYERQPQQSVDRAVQDTVLKQDQDDC